MTKDKIIGKFIERNELCSRWERVVDFFDIVEEVFEGLEDGYLKCWKSEWDCALVTRSCDHWERELIEDVEETFDCSDQLWITFPVLLTVVVVVGGDEINCWVVWVYCFCSSCCGNLSDEERVVRISRPKESVRPDWNVEWTRFVACLYKSSSFNSVSLSTLMDELSKFVSIFFKPVENSSLGRVQKLF